MVYMGTIHHELVCVLPGTAGYPVDAAVTGTQARAGGPTIITRQVHLWMTPIARAGMLLQAPLLLAVVTGAAVLGRAAATPTAATPAAPALWGSPFSVFQDMGPNLPTIFVPLAARFGIRNIGGGACVPNHGCGPFGIQTNGMGVDWPNLLVQANGTTERHNGGVPQAANLSAELAQMAVWIEKNVPVGFAGLACIDQEEFTNVWELHCPPKSVSNGEWSSNYGPNYCEVSKDIVRAAHPGWNESTVEAVAKIEFETAATALLVGVLELSKSLRPDAKWGYWMFPVPPFNHDSANKNVNTSNCHKVAGMHWQCTYDDPVLGERPRSYSDRQLPIWRASTGIFPSIYLEPFCPMQQLATGPAVSADCAARNTAFIRSVVKEAMRVSIMGARSRGPTAPAAPVIPFSWQFYLGTPPGGNSTHLVSVQEMRASITVPYELGAAGVVIWFDVEVDNPSNGSASHPGNTTQYFLEHTGPIAAATIAKAASCSATRCSSHGRCCDACGGIDPSVQCSCYSGFEGPTCGSSVEMEKTDDDDDSLKSDSALKSDDGSESDWSPLKGYPSEHENFLCAKT